jgi:hypothetical protein
MRKPAVVITCIALCALLCGCTADAPDDGSIWDDPPPSHNPPPPSSTSWKAVGIPEFAQASVNNMAFVIGPDDAPCVFYSNTDASGTGAVMTLVAGSWALYGGAAGFTDGTIDYPSMAFSPANVLYVAYQDGMNSNRITVMFSDGTPWTVQGGKGFSDGPALYTSIAFDSSGHPCVAYTDQSFTNKTIVRWYNGSDWSNYLGSDTGISTADAACHSLVLSPANTLYVAYKDDGEGGKACVKEYTSGWNYVGTPGFSADYAACITLVFDPVSHDPIIGYQDGGNGDKASVMRFSGGVWDYVGAPGVSADLATSVSLAVNSSGVIFVAYIDWAAANKATVLKYADGAWSGVGPSGFAPPVDCIYVACDSAGDPYVCYRSSDNQRVTVMAFKP